MTLYNNDTLTPTSGAMETLRHFSVRLPEALIVKLKIAAAKERTTAQAIIIEALETRLGRKSQKREEQHGR